MFTRLGAACLLGAAIVAAPLEAQVIEQVLVNVNGDIITLSEFEDKQVEMLRERPELAKLPPNSPQFLQAIAEITPLLILAAVDDLLWIQRAHEHGWSLTPERLDEIIMNVRRENNLQDEAAFKRTLQAEGLTIERLRQNIERSALIGQAQQAEVIEKISVDDTEIRAYYDANQKQFTKPAEITIREILVSSGDKGSSAADQQARASAEDARKRLLEGEPFPRLAAEVSSSATKSNGGLIGPLKTEDLDPALQKLFGAMKVGDITEVTQTSRGYQIFKLEVRTDAALVPLEDIRTDISRRVADSKRQTEMVKYLEKLRGQAKISWKHDELHKAYDRAVMQRLERAGLSKPAPKG